MFSEEAFIKSLQDGKPDAYAELYDRYGATLFQVILKIVKSNEDAENLLQDTFVKIWRNISTYDASKGRLFTWFVTIARHLAIDFCRIKYFTKKNMIQNEDSLVDSQSLSVEMFELDYLGINDKVNSLEDKLKQIIDLQFYYGYTQTQISEKFNIPLGTVKSRTRTALLQLRTKLSD
ncbi:MAG: sigma-70 family RNA polymerase sigma factor [Saprospiraceae bacterium]|nr:sigma-70 family RNA polymerase sigma factor [Candidatus Defluviibacterium haderslevense]